MRSPLLYNPASDIHAQLTCYPLPQIRDASMPIYHKPFCLYHHARLCSSLAPPEHYTPESPALWAVFGPVRNVRAAPGQGWLQSANATSIYLAWYLSYHLAAGQSAASQTCGVRGMGMGEGKEQGRALAGRMQGGKAGITGAGLLHCCLVQRSDACCTGEIEPLPVCKLGARRALGSAGVARSVSGAARGISVMGPVDCH